MSQKSPTNEKEKQKERKREISYQGAIIFLKSFGSLFDIVCNAVRFQVMCLYFAFDSSYLVYEGRRGPL